MAKSIYEIFDSKAIAAYWTDVNANMKDSYIGTQFFPIAKQTGLELAWIKGKNNLPVALQPSAFDTKATLRDRIGVTEFSTEMPFFREAMRIGEKDRQNIETLLAKGEKFAEPTIARIFDDLHNLIEGGLVQAERMRMQLLAGGKISVLATAETGRDVGYEYNYDDGTFENDNTVTLAGDAKWTIENKATSTPIDDLIEAKEHMATKYGVTVTRVLMNTTTLKGLLASDSITKAMNPVGHANVFTSKAERKAYIEAETGLKIIVYDKMFKNEQGQDVKFYPDGQCTLLPEYALGNTWYGTTPEEFDLLSGTSEASVSIVNTGVAVTTLKEAHPVNVKTIVSEIVLPSFERMSDIYIIKA